MAKKYTPTSEPIKVEARLRMESDEFPTTLGELSDAAIQWVQTYGPEAKIDFDAGHNNIDVTFIYMRDETPHETEARLKKLEEKRERNQLAHRTRAELCKCKHARSFHLGKSCCGDPEGMCECTQFRLARPSEV